jgi:hypothetical protein
MLNSSITVSAELALTLIVPAHGTVPLVDAIRMAFHVGTDEPVVWIFARELLAAGLASPAGDGDVRVWPGSAGRHEC